MSVLMVVTIIVISIILATFLVSRHAIKFAKKPPAPLIDMERMYDRVYENLDEETGSKVTPKELGEVLYSFVHVLNEHNLVQENLDNQQKDIKLDATYFSTKIKKHKPELDVDLESIEKIADLSLNYLEEINAIIDEV